MERLSSQFDVKTRKDLENVLETMECPRGFQCAAKGLENLCRERNFSGGDFPECQEKMDCQFKFRFGFLDLCRCPLRVYMFKRLQAQLPT